MIARSGPIGNVVAPSSRATAQPVVTIELIDGSARTGRLARAFVASAPDLVLELDAGGAPRSQRLVLAAERVACVCFHVAPGTAPASVAGAKRLRVHLAHGKTFVVLALLSTIAHPVGFMGTAVGGDAGFGEIFFYSHGINAREEDEPLGKMLIDAGVATPAEVEQGLAAQAVNRTMPIGKILAEQRGIAVEAIEEAARLQSRKRLRIGEVLIEAGLATAADIDAALVEQRTRKGKRLGELLVEMKVVSELDLAVTLAKKFHLPFVDLDQCHVNEEATRHVVPLALVQKYRVLPLDDDGKTLTIAIGDPLATEVVDVLRFQADRRVVEVVTTPTQLAHYVDRWCAARSAVGASSPIDIDSILRDIRDDQAQLVGDEEERPTEATVRDDDRGVIALVNRIVVEAVRRGASDIHIEPEGMDNPVAVRFRIDGECHEFAELPGALRSSLISRIKIMAKLDIAERRKPQDGKIRYRLDDKIVELRVATLPTVNGNEDVVMRVLASSKPQPLDAMGFTERNLRELRSILSRPYGLVLCVGPTGSGKTTTLHSALGSINTRDTKIWTAEDPVEITQRGLRQVQVQAKIGLTFAVALRAFLRADPDVIMVGEMRDEETASIAVEASLTGHLVLSTLHTNSAPETITRLLDMGLDPFSFGDALLGVLAQRLTRRLCVACRTHAQGSRAEYDEMVAHVGGPEAWARLEAPAFGASFRVGAAVGCTACANTGYSGRVALHELLIVGDDVKRAIARRASVDELRGLAAGGGMTTLLQDGVLKCLSGATDMRQVLSAASR